jgi:triacylglycerol lipase
MKNKIVGLKIIFIISVLTGVIASNALVKENETNHNPILFLHGGFRTKDDWNKFINWFQEDGWAKDRLFAYSFEDPENCSYEGFLKNAIDIKDWVNDILYQTGLQKVDLVCHSGGGLAGRYYIKFFGGINKVDDYVSLGSSHHGTTWDFAEPIFNEPGNLRVYCIELNEGDETPGGILNDTIGDRVDPTLEVTYNGTHIPGNINYTSIYTVNDETVIPYNSSRLDGAHNIEISGVSHSMYNFEFVYEHVKVAVNDLEATKSTIAFISVRDVLLFVGILVILKQINRRKFKF